MSAESCQLKVFLPAMLIHRFSSPFQLRQLQYSMVLQLAAIERKKGPQASKRAIGNAHIKSVLRHTVVTAHDYTVHISPANLFSCN